MKTAYLLFGLATGAACSSTPKPQYPLCDTAGAPACGNIGQVGRATKAPDPVHAPHPARAAAVTFASAATDTATRVVPALTHVLVGASREVQRTTPFARPLVDHREDVVCGNVMGKGSRRRVCHDGNGAIVAEHDIDSDGNAYKP